MKNYEQEHDFADALSELMQQSAAPEEYKKQRFQRVAKKSLVKAKKSAKTTHLIAKKQYSQTKKEFQTKDPADRSKIIKVAASILIVFAVLFILPAIISKFNSSNAPIDSSITKDLNFKPYYPTSTVSGYKIQDDSVKQPEPGVVLFSLMNDRGSLINVSQQPIPDDLDKEQVLSMLSDQREVDTPIGKATLGESPSGQTIANIFTDDQWVIIAYNQATIDDQALAELVKSLKKV